MTLMITNSKKDKTLANKSLRLVLAQGFRSTQS